MAGVADIPACLDADLDTLKGLLGVLDGFVLALGSLLNPGKLPELLPLTRASIFELMKPALGDVPSFSAEIGGIGISFIGKEIEGGLEIFDPKGLIKLIIGLITVCLGVPGLFFDGLDSTPPVPVPKVPTPTAVLDLVVGSLGLEINEQTITADFAVKLAGCIAKLIVPA